MAQGSICVLVQSTGRICIWRLDTVLEKELIISFSVNYVCYCEVKCWVITGSMPRCQCDQVVLYEAWVVDFSARVFVTMNHDAARAGAIISNQSDRQSTTADMVIHGGGVWVLLGDGVMRSSTMF